MQDYVGWIPGKYGPALGVRVENPRAELCWACRKRRPEFYGPDPMDVTVGSDEPPLAEQWWCERCWLAARRRAERAQEQR